MDSLINKVLLVYIISLYMFADRPVLRLIPNRVAVLFFLLVLFSMLYERKKVKITGFLYLFALFILVCCFSYFAAADRELVLTSLKGLFISFVVSLSLVNYIDSYEKLKKLAAYCVFSGTAASVYILLSSELGTDSRIGSVLGNENGVAIILSFSFMVSFYAAFFAKRKICIPCCAVMLTCILLTGSRKSVLMLLICMLSLLYCSSRRSIKKRLLFMASGILVLFAAYHLIYNVPLFYMVIGRRFEGLLNFLSASGQVDGSVLMRSYMTEFGFYVFKDRPILGYGLDNYRVLLESSIGVWKYSHNNLVELLVCTGLVGTIAYYSMILNVLLKLRAVFPQQAGAAYLLFSLVLSVAVVGYTFVHYESIHFYVILAAGAVVAEKHFITGDPKNDIKGGTHEGEYCTYRT